MLVVAANKKQLSPFFKLLHCCSVAPFCFFLVLILLLQIHMLETIRKWEWVCREVALDKDFDG